jgi:hypothetical protein
LAINKKLLVGLIVLATVAVVLTAVTAALLSTQQNIASSGDIQVPGGTQSTGGGSGGSSDTGGSSGNSGNTVNTINVDIYSDSAATIKCSSIVWGTLSPGGSVTKTIYIKNTGNIAETLNMTATSWSPVAAGSVLSLSWDKEGSTLSAGGVVAAHLTLQVAADTDDVTSFNVNIIISGTAS